MSSNNVRHLIIRTITTLQHFATLHHISPNYTSLHLTTLHFLSFTLHYPLICLNPITFRTALFYLTSLNQTQYSSPISKLISKIMNPFTALKKPSPFHFTSLFIYLFIFHLFYQPFTSLYFAIHIYHSLPFTSLPFTSYFLSPSLPLTGFHFPILNILEWKLHYLSGGLVCVCVCVCVCVRVRVRACVRARSVAVCVRKHRRGIRMLVR